MNEITKKRVAENVISAIERENLMNFEAAKYLGVSASCLSLIKNPGNYRKIGEPSWNKLHDWVVSGKKITEYKTTTADQDEPVQTPVVDTKQTAQKPGLVVTKTYINPENINKKIREIRERDKKRSEKEKGETPMRYDKGKPGNDEMANVLAEIGLEIDIIVKLKN